MTLSEFHPDLLESRQTNATVKLRRRIDRVMVKRGRFVGHSVDRFRYNRPLREGAKAVGSYCRAVAIVPFDHNRSVSRVLEISLVPDGSRNGSNPDLSVVVLNRLTLRYGLVLEDLRTPHCC